MKQYTIGLITGALLAISAMMFMGAQNKNLGDITVTSIKALNDDGDMVGFFGSLNGDGFLTTNNADGKETAYLGTGEGGNGLIRTFNADGKETAYLGTGKDGGGKLHTYNKHGVMTGGFGTNTENDGIATLYDRYGDIGWSASGKK